MARNVTNEVNAYEEDIERVVGIYAPHLGSELIHVTRTAEWRIVPKLLAVEPLTLKSGIAAPRSPVNNCGLARFYSENDLQFLFLKGDESMQSMFEDKTKCYVGKNIVIHQVDASNLEWS